VSSADFDKPAEGEAAEAEAATSAVPEVPGSPEEDTAAAAQPAWVDHRDNPPGQEEPRPAGLAPHNTGIQSWKAELRVRIAGKSS